MPTVIARASHIYDTIEHPFVQSEVIVFESWPMGSCDAFFLTKESSVD